MSEHNESCTGTGKPGLGSALIASAKQQESRADSTKPLGVRAKRPKGKSISKRMLFARHGAHPSIGARNPEWDAQQAVLLKTFEHLSHAETVRLDPLGVFTSAWSRRWKKIVIKFRPSRELRLALLKNTAGMTPTDFGIPDPEKWTRKTPDLTPYPTNNGHGFHTPSGYRRPSASGQGSSPSSGVPKSKKRAKASSRSSGSLAKSLAHLLR